ncbi:hypothetical protein [Burkholderia gladioli]|uniref:hypothetical protein n=1 Tax=Burkholderia gladioli TaxID=28095 RepID=UPI001641EB32|nr:hypothetical protein [Burkholderia gladioli]
MSLAHVDDITLPPFLPLGQTPGLRDLRSLLAGEVYTVNFPPGVAGQLMTHGPGELEGMKTTSIVGENGIVATAGLRRIDITPVVAHAILSLRQFSVVAKLVNELAERIGGIEKFILASKRAELGNVAYCLRDLSRRIDRIRVDASYKSYALSQLAAVKKTVGEYFLLNADIFRDAIKEKQSSFQKQSDGEIINTFYQLKYHEVFKTLSLIAIVELFEIVIEGSFSDYMFNAAKLYIQDRRALVAAELDSIYNDLQNILEWRNDERRQNEMVNYYLHEDRENFRKQLLMRAEEAKMQMLADSELIAQAFIDGFNDREIEKLFISTRDKLLIIEDHAGIALANDIERQETRGEQ